MQHFWALDEVQLQHTWLTIGSFDGVHRGHQEIVRKLVQEAHHANSQAVVLTFYPHPAVVLGKRKGAIYLTTPEQRAALLGEFGVDVVVTMPFTIDVSKQSAREFMINLKTHLDMIKLWVGYDFALGRGREGTPAVLRQIGEDIGYSVQEITPVEIDGEIVSSSKVRQLLTDGMVEEAARMLGRPYQVQGEVVPGDGRGRTIGIPTANLNIWDQLVGPKSGVYICRARLARQPDEWFGAVTNIGVRPTFDQDNPETTVETHILDFDADLYGKIVQIEFLSRLRDEQRFPSVDALVAQIHKDIDHARRFLAG